MTDTRNATPAPDATLADVAARVAAVYDTSLRPLASKFLFELPKSAASGAPTVLVLGNHSSGKSTFINFLLGEAVQRTGLAPTDDGFTVLEYGNAAEELDGTALVNMPSSPYSSLQKFGLKLMSCMKLKRRPNEFLKSVTLIDSPGMIDSAGNGAGRGYDFFAVVRELARDAGLVLLMFDPDKPGTTGETFDALKASLAGIDHKLLIVLNKADRFETMQDFARAYGVLCWNLARAIPRKDTPHIHTMFVPVDGAVPERAAYPLADFERGREEVVREVKRTPKRRAANLVSQLKNTAQSLDVHARVCSDVAMKLAKTRWTYYGLISATVIATVGIAWFFGVKSFAISPGTEFAFSSLIPIFYSIIGGAVTAGVIYVLSRFDGKFRENRALAELDDIFRRLYGAELSRKTDGEDLDMQALWAETRPRVERALAAGVRSWNFLMPLSRKLKAVSAAVDVEIPALKNDISKMGEGSN